MSQTTQVDPPITARRALTRERLMTAARAVFAERGIPGASVEEICEAAGFTRGAFYSNFPDKAALVLAMIRHRVETQYAAAERAVATMKAAGEQTPEELLAIALTAFERFGSEEPRETVLADRELLLQAARDADLREPYLAFMNDCMEQIAGPGPGCDRSRWPPARRAGGTCRPRAGRHPRPSPGPRPAGRHRDRPDRCLQFPGLGDHPPRLSSLPRPLPTPQPSPPLRTRRLVKSSASDVLLSF